jgi:hypothetical protein
LLEAERIDMVDVREHVDKVQGCVCACMSVSVSVSVSVYVRWVRCTRPGGGQMV